MTLKNRLKEREKPSKKGHSETEPSMLRKPHQIPLNKTFIETITKIKKKEKEKTNFHARKERRRTPLCKMAQDNLSKAFSQLSVNNISPLTSPSRHSEKKKEERNKANSKQGKLKTKQKGFFLALFLKHQIVCFGQFNTLKVDTPIVTNFSHPSNLTFLFSLKTQDQEVFFSPFINQRK